MKIIEVKLKDNGYKIYIEKNIFEKIAIYLKENHENKKIVIITDKNLEKLYVKALNKTIQDKNFKTKIISIEPGERSKSIDTLKKLYEDFTNFNLTRGDLILTFGGGVVGDLGGFAASTYLRGVPYIQIPTSLLAQVDSSVGGKVAVDLPWGKNLVGSFYQPKAVFIDPELLKTLDKRFLHDGLAEVIKYGCIRDESIFRELMSYEDDEELLDNIEKIIYTCCNIKKKVVESDEKDLGERMILNFGHTLGHAVEEYFNYSKYTHGEAVAIGMAEITRRSEELNITKIGTHNFIEKILMKYGLPYKRIEMDKEKILHTIKLDKKSSGENINLILLNKIGEGFIKKVSIREIENYI
ncbi:3-dehydroquinate synthase [Clostridium carboxidivorans P7]|uniref:3-dehydroquinate synthase n=1 Tax=Clostridium carboxidivorans TaxID=217159 RepID=UPI0001D39527|nr:3-dehydroquinate synthase [Clostridium carboxidivorans]AKN30479.1 3-dehydroquinate synthase [Clostridium carboxidivorans P7]EFG86224.1 3-dehydroquinate synthase [Clostridium carboxidivorans P7]